MPFLKKVTGDPAGQYVEIKAEEMTLGRSPECDIILNPGGVSRRHAQLRRRGDEVSLIDLGDNPTKLNNVELVAKRPYLLQQGDRINICDVELIYYTKLPVPSTRRRGEGGEVMFVTEGGPDESSVHTLDASRSSVVGEADPRTKLQAILEITRNLSSDLNIDTVAPKVLDSLFALYPQAERAFLVLKDAATGRLIRKAFKHRPHRPSLGRSGSLSASAPKDEAPTSLSRTIVNYVMEQKRAVLSSDAGDDKNLFPTSASIADLKIRSVMCAPLLTPDGQVLGILQLDTTASKQFQQDDLDLLVAVASQAAIAIQNAVMHGTLLSKERLDRDLKLAERIQKGFLPQGVPKASGYEFFAHYSPAYEVGGDYYDFVPLPGNRIAIALGDVSGKGVAAALMMAKFSGDTRYCILTEGAPGPAAEVLNKLLCAAGIAEKFITLSLGVLDLASGQFTLCSAGHLPVMIRRARGFVEEVGVDIGDLPLGIMPDSNYPQLVVSLEPGDVVVVYSDGVTDARGPEDDPYDTVEDRRLLHRVESSKGGPEAVGKAILQELREFAAGRTQYDDITLVCFGPVASATSTHHPGETLPIPGAIDSKTQQRPR